MHSPNNNEYGFTSTKYFGCSDRYHIKSTALLSHYSDDMWPNVWPRIGTLKPANELFRWKMCWKYNNSVKPGSIYVAVDANYAFVWCGTFYQAIQIKIVRFMMRALGTVNTRSPVIQVECTSRKRLVMVVRTSDTYGTCRSALLRLCL